MRVISIWQPYASLVVHNHKFNETRSWPAPKALIGQTIGIAATKNLTVEQRLIFNDQHFRSYYDKTGLPDITELPRGCILGTVVLHSCDLITEATLADITEEEALYGDYTPGRYAWRLRNPFAYQRPVLASGKQGIWIWDPHDVIPKETPSQAA